MSRGVTAERVAGHVLRDFTSILSDVVVTAYNQAMPQFETDNPLFAARNVWLGLVATHVGKQKEYEGALYLVSTGDPLVHYQSEEQLEQLIQARKQTADKVARLACDACPFKWECGIGPAQLQKELRDKGDRRRFRDRLHRQPLNDRMCERNLSRKRIVSKRLSA